MKINNLECNYYYFICYNENQAMKLFQVSHIFYGVTLRESVKPDADGNTRLIQMRDLQDDGTINYPNVARIWHLGIKQSQTIMRDDIPKKVAPEYLLWHLNHPRSQTFLASRAGGSNIKMIGKKELGELPITLPPLSQQQTIGAYARLELRRRALTAKLNQQQFTRAQARLWQLATHST